MNNYSCDLCDYKAHIKQTLYKHRRTKHAKELGIEVRPEYHCQHCGKGFKGKAKLNNHMATHTNTLDRQAAAGRFTTAT